MQVIKKKHIEIIKETIKSVAHFIPFIPYRKRSKRYKIWNSRREKRFLRLIEQHLLESNDIYNKIEVSIVMPIYNRAFCIDTAIRSIINQSHSHWKLYVIDDGSTDEIKEKIAKCADDKRIDYQYIDHKGVSHARNVGIEKATGKYIFYLDADNSWTSDYLRNMIVFLEKGKLDAAYSGVEIVNDGNEIIGYYGEEFNWIECLELNYIDINSFCHHIELVRNGLRFAESLKRFVDWDFILSISRNNRIAYAPFIGVIYYDGQEGNRITFTEYVGQEGGYLQEIRDNHSKFIPEVRKKRRATHLHWSRILKDSKNKSPKGYEA